MLTIHGAATLMDVGDFLAAANALLATDLPKRDGPRLLLTGTGHDSDGFHGLVEARGATITADDHAHGDWWHLDPVGDGPPMEALLRKYHLHAPSPRTFPRARGDGRLLAAADRARPDAAIFFTHEWDDTLGFDYPAQRDLLAARGIPTLFLPGQPYRVPDRAAQAEAVTAFLWSLRQEAPA